MALETVDIRELEACEFTPLLEAESRAWSENLRWDFAASARLIATCLEEKRLYGHALFLDGQMKGYCFFFYDGEKGLIGDLFVESSPSRLDQARWVLDRALETILGTPGLGRVEAQLPHFAFEDLDPCFRPHCFTGYRRRFMAVSLANKPRNPASLGATGFANSGNGTPPTKDFSVQPWERRFDHEAAQLLCQTYARHVDTLINDQYGSLVGSQRLIENIVLLRGGGEFMPQVSRVAIHRSTQKLAGILALTAVRPGTAHIPQIAVAREFQGTGLGTGLMESAFEDLPRQGFREVSLTVTDLNAGAVRLYERMGFRTFWTFGAYVWNRT